MKQQLTAKKNSRFVEKKIVQSGGKMQLEKRNKLSWEWKIFLTRRNNCMINSDIYLDKFYKQQMKAKKNFRFPNHWKAALFSGQSCLRYAIITGSPSWSFTIKEKIYKYATWILINLFKEWERIINTYYVHSFLKKSIVHILFLRTGFVEWFWFKRFEVKFSTYFNLHNPLFFGWTCLKEF